MSLPPSTPAWFDRLKSPDPSAASHWIWPPREITGQRSQTALFHRRLELPPGTVRIELHLSAETRYTLWINDQREAFGHGPARTDFYHRSVDTYEVDFAGPVLDIWAQVRWWAGLPEAPLAEMPGTAPGFWAVILMLDSQGDTLQWIGTDAAWSAQICEGLQDLPIIGLRGYHCIGQAEKHSSSGWPAGWRKDGAAALAGVSPEWWEAQQVGSAYFRGDPGSPWGTSTGHGWLAPREIAFPEESPLPIREILRIDAGRQALDQPPLQLAAGEQAELHCDVGEEVLAYLRVSARGEGLRIRVTASETVLAGGAKHFALVDQGVIAGICDEFQLDDAGSATFETSHWRAFRFLKIEALAGDQPAELLSLELVSTGYPMNRDWSFAGGAAPAGGDEGQVGDALFKMTDVSWRTLRRCAWETYMDCPHYEQMQYAGDARLQSLLTYVATGDITLPVQALRAFDRSRLPEGLTQSRFPCSPAGLQVIPTFSLLYILMIEDYLVHSGDEALVAELRPGIAPILNWFTQFIDAESGAVGTLPYWPFIDWVEGWDKGVPPHGSTGIAATRGGAGGASALVNLTYLLAMQSAASIYERTKAGSGNFFATRATALRQRFHDLFFDAGRGLLCDVPLQAGKGRVGVWSQHAQALGVLTGVLSVVEGREAMAIAMDPHKLLRPGEPADDTPQTRAAAREGRFLAPASLYFRFYLAEALATLGMGDSLWPLLLPFREALARGSTTWPESVELPPPAPPVRSECHAWGSWPLYFFARHLLGIAPPSAEDGRIRIHPLHCPPISHAKGRFMTYRGPVDVDVRWEEGTPTIHAAGAGVEVAAH
jgi:hypothetical protein